MTDRDQRDTGYVQRCDGCAAEHSVHYIHNGERYHFIREADDG